jgi:hypothetical protein
MPPSVASKGQDGDRLRRLRRFEEQALQQRVDPVGVALDGRAPGGSLVRFTNQLLPRPFEQGRQAGGRLAIGLPSPWRAVQPGEKIVALGQRRCGWR